MSEVNDLTTFHVQLLTKIIDIKKFPLTKLVIQHNLSQDEYSELFNLLDKMNKEYNLQKEEGLLNYSSLLIQFVGMLNEKLKPKETIYALKQEGFFPDLLGEFTQIIEKDGM